MSPIQLMIIPPMGAVILGLLIFAGLLLLGLAIIRRLGLPQDLPEALHFEPPPPDIRDPTSNDTAVAIAARRRREWERLTLAHAAASDGQVCQETLALLEAFPGKDDPVHAAAVAELRTAAARGLAAGGEAERIARRLREDPDDASDATLTEVAARAAAARRAVDEACSRLPDGGGNRRLMMMLGLLVVLAAWLAAMRWLLHG